MAWKKVDGTWSTAIYVPYFSAGALGETKGFRVHSSAFAGGILSILRELQLHFVRGDACACCSRDSCCLWEQNPPTLIWIEGCVLE